MKIFLITLENLEPSKINIVNFIEKTFLTALKYLILYTFLLITSVLNNFL